MSYDPVKAHEYYEKYRKKGLLKGRSKKTEEEKKNQYQKDLDYRNAKEALKEKIRAERKKEYDHLRAALNLYLKRLRQTWKQQGMPKESQKAKAEEIRGRTKEARKKIHDKYAAKYKEELASLT